MIGDVEKDLCVRAARLLMETFDVRSGVRIHVEKRHSRRGRGRWEAAAPHAATVLIGLNRLFGLGLSRSALMELGERLGADVPFFIFGRTGFVAGALQRSSPRWKSPLPHTPSYLARKGHFQPPRLLLRQTLTRDTKSLKIDILSGKALEIWPNLYGQQSIPAECGARA